MLDGTVIAASAWGTPIPVDAGEHVVEAQGQGRRNVGAVTARERERATIVVASVGRRARRRVLLAVATLRWSARRSERFEFTTQPAPTCGKRRFLAIGIGHYFGISAITSESRPTACGPDTCLNQEAAAHNNKAVTRRDHDAAFGVGLVAAGLATYWF